MEKADHSQLELFSRQRPSAASDVALPQAFLSRIWRYEKTILIIIGFITVGIASFSLGVEKGRHSVMAGTNFQRATVTQPSGPMTAPAVQVKIAASQPLIQKQPVIEPLKEKAGVAGYTIQVASFQAKTLAQKEAERLKGRGHAAIMLSKNGYTILCVGKFSDKNTARVLLQELKKSYTDCYIRRL
jgi:cell division septation protein DedD